MPPTLSPPAAVALPEPAGVPAVELRGIHKRFGEVQANRDIHLTVARGSIHGLVGENGAGKSTLMSILYGFHEPDAGSIHIGGREVRLRSAQEAIAQGVGMVHQHFMLVERFTVLENVVLGAEGGFSLAAPLGQARRELQRLAREFGLAVEPDARVRDLPVGALQRVEILKALYRGARILILDEPTGVLTPQESEQLFAVLAELKARGVTILLVTHKLKEIMATCDQVTVMRGGSVVATRPTRETSEAELAELMVGRKVVLGAAAPAVRVAETRLAAEGLWWRDAQGVARLQDVSLELRAGEIVGVVGVAGNGQSELLALLSGMQPPQQGRIRHAAASGGWHDASHEHPIGPRELRRLGVAHVPEDRHRQGLVLGFPMWESAALGYQDDPALRRGPFLLSLGAMRAACRRMMEDFDVRPRNERLGSAKFSGGNQQKLILAREFQRAPRVLLIGQPTRGVDIGAIEFIHKRIVALRDAGCAVLLVSTELEEILALADRIVVMCGGRITGELPRSQADERRLGALMGAQAASPAAAGPDRLGSADETPPASAAGGLTGELS
ncbi:ABC transporter ATP-binding protein [Eleftheria terrae]|uniref:ABC transporter ATP-binding protein n=1 Tax=Eleftheria terrae TaxID=1597781 RepID=UPI00263B9287|nr:ABC transporter ATP-binding protein [Eleftheria terrae]WKB53201.1 ABC transporter ATP-binding protein [Eleftheria terrae]